ncbi:LytR/AlgR family response regulator transcription factor [Marinifilum sp. RC60d5]|uniref:LytR/AlgR family response regulator transcription factor n=1 Tax=Marinifilum sp. RC60d5 TaxID=3458414 RepID=UPI0040365252
MIRIFIIDDHQEDIDELKLLLLNYANIEIVGEAIDPILGIREIIYKKPDLVFLNVEMPSMNGFEILNELIKLPIECPKVVFITPFDNYAIEALHSNAVDYLLKPVDADDLSVAIQRYISIQKNGRKIDEIKTLIHKFHKNNRVLLPSITGFKHIKLKDVLYFVKDYSSPNHVQVYYDQDNCEVIAGCCSLKRILELLPSDDFLQVDRQTIINLDYLSDIEVKSRKCFLVKNDKQFEISISRGRLRNFMQDVFVK